MEDLEFGINTKVSPETLTQIGLALAIAGIFIVFAWMLARRPQS